MFYLNYGVSNNFSLEALIPWQAVTNEKILFTGQSSHQPEGGKYVRHSQGFGDALVMGRYQLDHKKVHMALAAGIKLASGNANATDLYGTRIPDNLQIGSGTVDPVFALFGAYTGMNWIVHGNIFSRIPLRENIYGYKYGLETHANMGVNYDLSDLIFLRSHVNVINTSRDRYQYGELDFSRGGLWVYFVPGLGIRVSETITIDLQYPLPIYQFVNESQLVPSDLLTMNFSYTLSKE